MKYNTCTTYLLAVDREDKGSTFVLSYFKNPSIDPAPEMEPTTFHSAVKGSTN